MPMLVGPEDRTLSRYLHRKFLQNRFSSLRIRHQYFLAPGESSDSFYHPLYLEKFNHITIDRLITIGDLVILRATYRKRRRCSHSRPKCSPAFWH